MLCDVALICLATDYGRWFNMILLTSFTSVVSTSSYRGVEGIRASFSKMKLGSIKYAPLLFMTALPGCCLSVHVFVEATALGSSVKNIKEAWVFLSG